LIRRWRPVWVKDMSQTLMTRIRTVGFVFACLALSACFDGHGDIPPLSGYSVDPAAAPGDMGDADVLAGAATPFSGSDLPGGDGVFAYGEGDGPWYGGAWFGGEWGGANGWRRDPLHDHWGHHVPGRGGWGQASPARGFGEHGGFAGHAGFSEHGFGGHVGGDSWSGIGHGVAGYVGGSQGGGMRG
jgi:hypothetical protein